MYSAMTSELQRRWGQAVCYWEDRREKAREKRNVFRLDLNTASESLLTIYLVELGENKLVITRCV